MEYKKKQLDDTPHIQKNLKPLQQVMNDLIELNSRWQYDIIKLNIQYGSELWLEQYRYYCLARQITLNEGGKL